MFSDKILYLFFLTLPFQLGRHFWPADSFIFGLKIDYLSPTFYLQDILIFFLLFFGLLKKNKLLKLPEKRSTTVFFLLSLLFAFINIYFSLNRVISFFSWLRIGEMFFLGVFIFQNSGKAVKMLYQTTPLVVVFEFFVSFLQVVKQSSLGGIFWFLGERTFSVHTPGIARAMFLDNVFLRPYGTFSHPNSLAGFILICLIILFSKNKLSLIDKLAIICGLFLLLLAFSRTVWITASLIGLGYLITLIKKYFFKKNYQFNFYYLMVLVFLPVFGYFFSRTTLESSSVTGRIQLAEVAVSIIKKHPFFGVGAGNFIIALSQQDFPWSWLYWLQPVHNVFLLLAAEQGLIVIVFFAGLFYLLFKSWFSSLTKSSLQNGLAICLLAIFFIGLFDHYWLTLIQNQLLFVLIVSLFVSSLGDKIKAG